MSLSKEKISLLRKFVDFECKSCKKNEEEVGVLEPHKINPELGYTLNNIKMSCSKCHEIFSSAQRIANGLQA